MQAANRDIFKSLDPGDPPPVELAGADRRGPAVLTCEHGGRATPRALAAHAPPGPDMARHIAFDPGAAAVARRMAARLDAPLAIQRYSRLVIDCNRPRHAPDLAPEVSDGTSIPFNAGLGGGEIDARWRAIHAPFHDAVAGLLDARAGRPMALAAIHSFTPRLRDGPARPFHVGLLARADLTLAEGLAGAIRGLAPDAPVALNQPYAIEDASDVTIPRHGEARGLPHVLIEIRNDLIADAATAARWGDLLAEALARTLPMIFASAKDRENGF